ncbi:MAG: DNA-processing protein DprA [Spirochaetia bacterium]|nr:DNA-processing protein DprA [Spirochaetia bacterium]
MRNELLPLAISAMQFLSFREKLALEEKLDTIGDLAVLSIDDISYIVGRRIRSRWWKGTECQKQAEQSMRLMEVYGIHGVLHHQLDYPALVAEIFDPPYMLFYRGNIQAVMEPCLSVVGTRKPTPAVAKATFDFSQEAAVSGYTLVSGLAFGIDAAVHKGALAGNGKTVAVLPCGADGVVPLSHKRLAATMLEREGCLLSEYLPGVPAEKFRFPQRNRIIAALSPVTVVAAAPEKSGALITAEFALEQGRDVYLLAAGLAETCCSQGMEAYRQDGAPVISSVAEYEAAIAALPGNGLEIAQAGGNSRVGRISAETRYCRQEKQLLF